MHNQKLLIFNYSCHANFIYELPIFYSSYNGDLLILLILFNGVITQLYVYESRGTDEFNTTTFLKFI